MEIRFFLKVPLRDHHGGSALDKKNCSICTDVAISLVVEPFSLRGYLSNSFHQDHILLGWNLPLDREPLPNTTCPDYALHVGVTGIEALYGAFHLCFPVRISLLAFPLDCGTSKASVHGKFFCLFWICCLWEMGKRCSEHPMIRAGWGLLAALRQDLPAHLIHLHHNHMLLLGDYVLVSSLCN